MKRILTLLFLLFATNCFAWSSGGWDSGMIGANLIGTGYIGGGATTIPTGTTALTPVYSIARVFVTTRTLTIADGVQGQVLCLIGEDNTDTGTLTITATTKTGWTSIALDAVRDTVTLLFVDNTIGWIVIGNNSVTVS